MSCNLNLEINDELTLRVKLLLEGERASFSSSARLKFEIRVPSYSTLHIVKLKSELKPSSKCSFKKKNDISNLSNGLPILSDFSTCLRARARREIAYDSFDRKSKTKTKSFKTRGTILESLRGGDCASLGSVWRTVHTPTVTSAVSFGVEASPGSGSRYL